MSQFTLVADTTKGEPPELHACCAPRARRAARGAFRSALRAEGVPVETGRFGAHMAVSLVNDGPVTIVLEL